MTNSELLAYTGPASLLTSIERQSQFILRMENTPLPCPNCGQGVRRWEALGLALDAYDLTTSHPDTGECPGCGRGLIFIVPMIGGWHWSLVPDPAFHVEPGGVERPEGYYHSALEPAEGPPSYCGLCGTYHNSMDCPDDEPEDEDDGEPNCLPGHAHSWVVRDDNEEISYCENCGADGNG